MTYDRDLRFIARVIIALMVLNFGGAIVAAFLRQWLACGAFLLWCLNAKLWHAVNRNMQHQRDRNRLIEAALATVHEGRANR